MYVSEKMYIHVSENMYVQTYVQNVYMYVCMFVCMYASEKMYVHVCMYMHQESCMYNVCTRFLYVQPIPLGVTFSNAVSKLKAQSLNVSFH